MVLSAAVANGIIVVLLVLADRVAKYFAFNYLQTVGTIPVIDGLFHLTYVENNGAAFGILEGGRWFFIIITVVVTAAVIAYYFKLPRTKKYDPLRFALVLIIAGAIGNFIDRLLNGYVVDFLQIKLFDFPVFNTADVCVVVGTIFMAFLILFTEAGSNE